MDGFEAVPVTVMGMPCLAGAAAGFALPCIKPPTSPPTLRFCMEPPLGVQRFVCILSFDGCGWRFGMLWFWPARSGEREATFAVRLQGMELCGSRPGQ